MFQCISTGPFRMCIMFLTLRIPSPLMQMPAYSLFKNAFYEPVKL